MVKYNGTQKNYYDTDFLYIHVLYAYIFILVCSSVPEHHIEQILNLFHKWFSICTCVYVILYSKNYQLYHACNTILAFSPLGKKIKSQVPVNSFTFFFQNYRYIAVATVIQRTINI